MEGLLEDVTEQGLQGVGSRPCILDVGHTGRAQLTRRTARGWRVSPEVREVADRLQSSSQETRRPRPP